VHAIVAYSKNEEQLMKIGSILDQYDKYAIRALFGKKTEEVNSYVE
jgi:hypothetical protein